MTYFVDRQGETPGDAGREIDRYTVTRGQACSFKLGHPTVVAIREKTEQKQGARFDLKVCHTAVLRYGRVPLEVLTRVGDDWIPPT